MNEQTGSLLPEDELEASVGLTEKQVFAFGSAEEPFVLENWQTLPRVEVAYQSYGTLSSAKDNVILVLHGITGSSHAAGKYAPSNRSTGYWDGLIGPGKAFDTDRWFVVAPNILGGCRGSTGPSSTNPATGRPYGLSFPIVTIRDMVRVQQRFLKECFGIERVAVVAGGSMGGMQALEWAVREPSKVDAVIPIATAARANTRAIAFNECARRAIMLDPRWARGEYYDQPDGGPDAGLALARMIGTITYLSDPLLEERFGRTNTGRESALEHDLHARFDVEKYLHEEGDKLVRRFDANSYLYLSRAMDLHDVSRGLPSLRSALERITARCLLVGIRSDDLFPVRQTEEIVRTLRRAGNTEVRSHIVDSHYGHDAFLVEWRKMVAPIRHLMGELIDARG